MLYPNAQHRLLTVNFSTGGITPRLQITHIMQGTLFGTDLWFHNPASQVSAHFGVAKDGQIVQWVDTANRAWHAAAANSYAIGVENEGSSGEPLTDAQLDANAELFSWLNEQYPAIDLWLNSRPFTGHGLSWHGLGGIEWGNHPHCPGAPIVHQLPEIVRGAKNLP